MVRLFSWAIYILTETLFMYTSSSVNPFMIFLIYYQSISFLFKDKSNSLDPKQKIINNISHFQHLWNYKQSSARTGSSRCAGSNLCSSALSNSIRKQNKKETKKYHRNKDIIPCSMQFSWLAPQIHRITQQFSSAFRMFLCNGTTWLDCEVWRMWLCSTNTSCTL